MQVSVIVPVYNGAKTIEQLAAEVEAALRPICTDFELILVNDGGQDESWKVITAMALKQPWIRGLELMRNYGQHNALLCGIREARYPVCVTLDDDLQHPPAQIGHLLEALTDDVDLVYATPMKRKQAGWRNLSSLFLRLALSVLLGWRIAGIASPFRAFRTQLRDAFSRYDAPNVLVDALFAWATVRYASVSVEFSHRKHGRSGYTFVKLINTAVDIVTSFSVRPLRIAALLGLVLTLMGAGALSYTLTGYLIWGRAVPGFYFLATMISLFSGAQLFSLGIIGEYLGRVHMRTMARPAYVVRNQT